MHNRFEPYSRIVSDLRTGLMWSRDAAPAEFPLTWKEAFDFVHALNSRQFAGYGDWRLPNRRELFSLVSHSRINPALPEGHPFENVFPGYYWSATTCARLPDQAWYVHMGGAKIYRGMKHASYMVWPVRTQKMAEEAVFQTGEKKCFDELGRIEQCEETLQGASVHAGRPWPTPRFEVQADTVTDHISGLTWMGNADPDGRPVAWQAARDLIGRMNRQSASGYSDWRLPHIRELESLVDLSAHSPALPTADLFEDVRDFYWSATTSQYETRYAWALYLKDGAVGVGFKPNPEFFLWPVRGGGFFEAGD
ncbi:MAG: DUF1566 domain-containing protein [Desulfobacterales bacterium]|nr:DUF1566 domain-containing protein [Desulfobacterales bacterium]